MKIGIIQENFLVADFAGNAAKIESQILKVGSKQIFLLLLKMTHFGAPIWFC